MIVRGAIPLHLQVATTLRNRIHSGDLVEGAPLLTEEKLMEHFGVSRTVIRQAVLSLVQEGLVTRLPGKGTFVRPKEDRAGMDWSIGSINDLLAFGKATRLEILDRAEVSAPPSVAEALALAAGSTVFLLRARRHSAAGVISYQCNYLLPDIGRRIREVEFSDATIYSVLEQQANLTFDEIVQTSTAVPADMELARILEVEVNQPLLQTVRVFYSTDRGPVQYSLTRFRPDRYRHMVRLRRPQVSQIKALRDESARSTDGA